MSEAKRKTPTQWRIRLFHLWFLLRRPMTLGVRAVVHERATGSVLLVRHTYVSGWHLPGGGIEVGETAETALRRELREEANVELAAAPELRSFHLNRAASRRDHVAVFLVTDFVQTEPKAPDSEIAEAGFFPVEALPHDTTPATRRRLGETLARRPASSEW